MTSNRRLPPTQDIAVAAAWILIVGAVGVSDVFHPVNRFWVGHPAATAVVVAVLLLFAGYYGFQRWVVWRLQDATERVGRIAFSSLGRILGDLQDGLEQLVITADLPSRAQARLDGIVGRHEQLVSIDSHDHVDRLAVLLDDDDWYRVALPTLDFLKWRMNDRVAGWAPLMLATRELAERLDEIAGIADHISALRGPLLRLLGERPYGDVDAAPETEAEQAKTAFRKGWSTLLCESTRVYEKLIRHNGPPDWLYPNGRRRLGYRDPDLGPHDLAPAKPDDLDRYQADVLAKPVLSRPE